MQITIFGASGKVGRGVVAEALKRGYTVTAFVHTHNPFGDDERIHVVKGSIDDATAVELSLKHSSAVISTLSSWHSPDKNVLSQAMETILPIMNTSGISRIVTLTGAGALTPDDTPSALDKIAHAAASVLAGKVLADAEQHLKLLEASQLDWTCVRSPVMTRQRRSTYRLRAGLASPFALVPRVAVVQALIDQLDDATYYSQAPSITNP